MKKYKFWLAFAIIISFFISSINVYAYGFGYQRSKNHGLPNIGKYKEILDKNDAYYVGDTNSNKIYLTFDCGYENGYTLDILKVLKEKNVKATFFVTGHYLKSSKDIVLKMIEEGHIIANHTNKHRHLTKSNKEEIIEDVKTLEEMYKELTGNDITPLYRPPAGEFDDRSLSYIKDLGYKTLFWSIAYKDWDCEQAVDVTVSNLEKELHNGAIILLHAVSKTNSLMLDKFIDKARTNGYEFGETTDFLGNSF